MNNRFTISILSALLLSVVFCSILISCGPQPNIVKGKVGGIYETNEKGKLYNLINTNEQFYLDTLSYISFDDFDVITKESTEYGTHKLVFRLNDQGALKFKDMTERNLNKQICIVIQDVIIVAANVAMIIENGEIAVSLNQNEDSANHLYWYLTN